MRKVVIVCLVMILAISSFPIAGLAANAPKVFLNGKELTFDVPPEIVNGRTFVPLRTIFEELGAEIHWDGNTQTVTATKGSVKIVLKIGEAHAYVNDEMVSLDAPAKIVSGRTLVPLRFVSESLDFAVDWDDETWTITITSPTYQKVMTAEEAIQLFKSKLEEIGVRVVDSGFGVRLSHGDEHFPDVVIED